MIRNMSVSLLCTIILMSIAIQASAEIVHYEYSGEIESFINETALDSKFSLNDAMLVRFSYDTDAPDVNTDPDVGAYAALSLSIDVTHNGGAISTYSGSNPFVRNGNNITSGSATVDYCSVLAAGTQDNISTMQFQLADYNATALSDDSLPADIPDLSLFQTDKFLTGIFIDFSINGSFVRVKGKITGGGKIDPVPVPGAIWLFASGLAGLAAMGRRKSRD